MVTLKLRKFGNSLGVILPSEVLARLDSTAGNALYLIDGPDGSYRLTPYDPAFGRKLAKAEQVMARYRNALHELAK